MDTKIQVITIGIENQLYGIDVRSLQEILPILKIKPIAKGPLFLEGIINLRGKVIPVADLRKLLGAKSCGYTFDTRIIVACIETRTIGFIVDEVKEFREFMKDQISALVVDGPNAPLVENVVTLSSGQMIQLIILNHVLSKDELEQLSHIIWDSQL